MTAALKNTTRAEDIKRWMALEYEIKNKSVRYQEEKAARIEAMREDDAKRVSEVFALFDYDNHKYLPVGDLPMILKAVGCDDETAENTTLSSSSPSSSSSTAADDAAQTFTLEELLPVALDALAVGRDGFSEASTRAAFFRFSTRSHKHNPATAGASSSSSSKRSHGADTNDNSDNGGAAAAASSSDPYAQSSTNGVLALDFEGLRAAFAHCGARISEDELKEILQYADLDGDGVIGEEDWMAIMKFVLDTQ